MRKLLLLLLFLNFVASAQYKNGLELLKAMHDKHSGKYCQTVQFDQKTVRYVNQSAKDTSYWYEWISYPDKFRIDFGKKYGGNCVIFRNDSVFNYRNNKLVKKGKDENDLLLLLGGMYFRKYDDVIKRLKNAGYPLDGLNFIVSEGKPAHLIGAYNDKAENKHQIWVDTTDMKVIKLKTRAGEADWLEIRLDAFKKTCNGFTETKVSAYKNGTLEQKEEYLNLKTGMAIPDSIFYKKN